MSKKSGLGKFLLGAGIGVGLGILFAPISGKETRKDLLNACEDLLEKAKNIDIEEVKIAIINKVKDINEDIKNLDKETVAKNIKSQSKKIKKKADELVEFAAEKSTPVIQNAAKKVKNGTAKVLEDITEKLKEEEPKKVVTKKNTKTSK